MNFVKSLSDKLLSPDATVRDAMERINRQTPESQFQLVADADGRLLGTITDGDIRRAILRGVGIDDPVLACMNAVPITGGEGETAANAEKLRSVGTHSPFLPVVSIDGKVVEILVLADEEQADVRALVMAGGFGARLGERTRSTPKPLLPVGGKPILEHILERLEAAGVTDIMISVHYLADKIEAYIGRRTNRASISFLPESSPLGTAGAVGNTPGDPERPLMVLNGDVLTSLDFKAFIKFNASQSFDATVAVAQYEIEIPFGVIRHGKDGIFQGVDEKPRLTNFIAAGIYMFSPLFQALVAEGERLDMPELLERGREAGLITGLFPIHEYWTDIGRPLDLEAAENLHAAKP